MEIRNVLRNTIARGVVCASVLVYTWAFADTVTLKSGKVIEGTVVDDGGAYITVQRSQGPVYYERKFIQGINHTSLAVSQKPGEVTHTLDFVQGIAKGIKGDFDAAKEDLQHGVQGEYAREALGLLALIERVEKNEVTVDYAKDFFRGMGAFLAGDYESATQYFIKVYALEPSNPDVAYNIAVAYYDWKKPEQAVEYLNKMIVLSPEDPEAYYLLGNAYGLMRDPQKAKEYLTLARTLFKKQGDAAMVAELDPLIQQLSAPAPQ